ncbi:hypothetical protein [Amorphus orientalis]|uniref:Uncharacterized protein n=1 Tax=Amorphus orientalis TaxID=649198 RepID=A0AAE4ATK2_9HYPH|nr:hypothetical protein [Amorphus orientalis]MDQ0316393.1 hypothetical protein [Amorphus orientalis]
MHILLVTKRGTEPLTDYEAILEKRGFTFEYAHLDDTIPWSGGDIDFGWLARFCRDTYGRRAEAVDAVQFFIEPEDWQTVRRTTVGRQYHKVYSSYLTAIVKRYRHYGRVAEHELTHMLDDIVRIYLGISLARIVGVDDWDEDVVHGRDTRFEEYEYDRAFEEVKLYVSAAIQKRKRLSKLTLTDRALVYVRMRLIEISRQVEEITVPEENDLYRAAMAALGTDASPNDAAPDELGCAETVSSIIRQVLPEFPVITGTWTLWERLRKGSEFTAVAEPRPGDIVIAPTGTVRNAPFPGHVGIVGKDGIVMSNDSGTGTFNQNYTIESWHRRYAEEGGYPIYYYRLNQ